MFLQGSMDAKNWGRGGFFCTRPFTKALSSGLSATFSPDGEKGQIHAVIYVDKRCPVNLKHQTWRYPTKEKARNCFCFQKPGFSKAGLLLLSTRLLSQGFAAAANRHLASTVQIQLHVVS